MLSGRCLEVSGRCVEGLWRVNSERFYGRCPDGFKWVSVGCLVGVWRVSGRCCECVWSVYGMLIECVLLHIEINI